jgi:beta-lactamase class A
VLVLFLCAGSVATLGIVAARDLAKTPAARAVTAARRNANARGRAKAKAAKPVISPAQRALTAAMTPVASDDGNQVAVAVDDLTAGSQAAYAGSQEFVTASIVKIDILATLLYQAQQSGLPLSSQLQVLATTMIENSNNDAASDLYKDAGGAASIDQANQAFGLSQTTVGTAGYWGLTTTTVDDQLRLLRLVFTRSSVLTAQSQDYIQGLMSQVEADQQWGVPAAAEAGTTFMVKNGWLPSGTTGLWEINSIGEVVHDGHRMLIAILSEGNATEDSGISLVQTIATKAATAALTPG